MAGATQIARSLRLLEQYRKGRTTQPGMFSTLDEIIAEAPFETNSADQWAKYLKPGRMLKREGAQFPLKKEELDWSLSRMTIDPSQKFTKEQLRELISDQRPVFGVTMGREAYDDSTKLVGIGSEDPFPEHWMLGKTDIEMDVEGMPHPQYGDDYGGERLFHKSPGSLYEESVSRMAGLNDQSHFDPDTLSWSRTSTHTLPQKSFEQGYMPTKVRLIEEIQSDLHSRAAKKVYTDPKTGMSYDEFQASNERSLPKGVESKGLVEARRGYMDDDNEIILRELNDQMDAIRGLREELHSVHDAVAYDKLTMQLDKISELELQYLHLPTDAPYKNPGDYAGLELKKQLLNAVDNDEDYLAITRGIDQIKRYEAGMGSRQSAGMEKMYDEVYPSELKKLAKRYGATVEDVEIPMSASSKDVRPRTMAEMDYETTGEVLEDLVENVESYGGGGSYDSDINMIDSSVENIKEIMDETLPEIHSYTGFPEDTIEHFNKLTTNLDAELRSWDDKIKEMAQDPDIWDPAFEEDVWRTKMRKEAFKVYEFVEETIETYQQLKKEIAIEGVTKNFPAMKLTPEVKEKIRELGVPQFQLGGLVRPDRYGGQEYIPSMEQLSAMPEPDLERLRDINYTLTGGTPKRELLERMEEAELYEDPQYWKDVPKHVLASMASLWKTLDPETGEAEWNFGASPPPFEMVERGIMTLEEWKEMKETADRVREEKPSKPGIIDETISMRVLMTEIANIFRDEREEPPKYAAEAMERTERLQQAVQEGMDLDPAVGFPQRFASMMGFMLGQVPSPKSLTESVGAALVKAMPKATAKIPKSVKVGIGAPLEFMDPTIRPAAKTYLTGAGAGTGILYGIEAAAERRLRELQEQLDAEQE